MKKLVLGGTAALVLATAALASTGASAGWKKHHFKHGWHGPKIIIGGGYVCPRIPVTVFTKWGPVVKFVRSCNGYF
jgi:hypothetical protein